MEINGISFNQYGSHLTCATSSGFTIYTLSPSIQKKIHEDKKGGVGIMKILRKSNIHILTGEGKEPFSHESQNTSKNTVVLWDQYAEKVLVKIDCNEPIKNLQIHHTEKIVVVLDKKVIVFNFAGQAINNMKTYSNPFGLCEITYLEKPKIVTLGNHKGEITVWNITSDTQKSIQAHDSNIACIALSKDGKMVATASEKGTLIRVFSTESGKRLYEFRRGTHNSQIYSLAFSYPKENKGIFLACCSSRNGTVHLFDLYKSSEEMKNTQSVFSGLQSYLPVGSDWVGSEWSFQQHYIGTYEKTVCEFDEKGALHVATYDGKYYKIGGKNYETMSSSDLLIGLK